MKLPFDVRALWDRALTWYRSHGERDRRVILGVLIRRRTLARYASA